MDALYPEPPHLTIAVYPGLDEVECFANVCALVEEADCTPNGVVEVLPWDRTFEYRSDLADVIQRLRVDGGRHAAIMAGDPATGRPVRAGFAHRKLGVVVAEYLAAPSGDQHPIGVSLGAGALGVPRDLWKGSDRAKASQLAQWSTDLLRVTSASGIALYGGIATKPRWTPSSCEVVRSCPRKSSLRMLFSPRIRRSGRHS